VLYPDASHQFGHRGSCPGCPRVNNSVQWRSRQGAMILQIWQAYIVGLLVLHVVPKWQHYMSLEAKPHVRISREAQFCPLPISTPVPSIPWQQLPLNTESLFQNHSFKITLSKSPFKLASKATLFPSYAALLCHILYHCSRHRQPQFQLAFLLEHYGTLSYLWTIEVFTAT